MRYTDAELLEELEELAEELGHPPTLSEFRSYSDHSATTYYERFGSWNAAIAAAGFEPRDPTTKISRAELLLELNRLTAELGEPPSAKQMNEQGSYWASTYRNRFGSWNAAVEAAELEPEEPTSELSKSTLIEEMRRLADELGEPPTFSDMDKRGEFSASTYVRTFGSWNAAVSAAGFEPSNIGTTISDSELLAEIRRLATALEKRPSAREMDDQGAFSAATYQRRFSTWSNAVEKALSETEE